MANKVNLLAYRGSHGHGFVYGPPQKGVCEKFPREDNLPCRDMIFSKDGSLFAWCNGETVKLLSTKSFDVIWELERPRVTGIAFSPKGTYIATWQPYIAQENQKESFNLHIWSIREKKCIKSFIQKKQVNWCPEWTDDEHLCARNVNNEVHFFEANDYSVIGKKILMQKVSTFSLAPGPPNYHVACYVPGVKAQPSFVRLFKYPIFDGAGATLAQKSFFKADRAEFFWNKSGKDLIVLSMVDVDKSGASYYGEQNLYYLSTKGETAKIMLGKDGPVYAVKWSPNCSEFCVVYGYMPAKATIYNLKCEAVFDFGTGPRNEIHYSTLGNRLILCGFGNLRGHVEVWDMKDKKKISNFIASDSTCLLWSPDGEYVLTCTTAPRLRIGNGYRIWHYSGSLLQETFIDEKHELWDMKWMPVPEECLKESSTNYKPVAGIQSAQPQASKEVYRPPSARGQPSSFRLHRDEASKVSQENEAQALSKNKKKSLARKAKKAQEKTAMSATEGAVEETQVQVVDVEQNSVDARPDGSSEKEKRIRSLLKKLDQIKKLKEDQKSGKTLEKNQIDKIKKEEELLQELQSLQI